MTSPVNRSRLETSAATRERILDAALENFRKGGLEAVSIRNIAAEAGLSPMGIYRHFANHESIVNALVDGGLEILRTEMHRAHSGAGLPLVRKLLRVYIDFALAEPAMFDLVFLSHRESDAPFLDDYKAGTSPSFEILRSAVEQAMERGDLSRANSVDVTVTLWAQCHGLVALYVAGRFGKGEMLFRRFFSRSLDSLIAGLRS